MVPLHDPGPIGTLNSMSHVGGPSTRGTLKGGPQHVARTQEVPSHEPDPRQHARLERRRPMTRKAAQRAQRAKQHALRLLHPSQPLDTNTVAKRDRGLPSKGAVLHTVAASTTYGCSLYYIRLPPLLHTVTASTTYGHSLYYMRPQPLLHTATASTTCGDSL